MRQKTLETTCLANRRFHMLASSSYRVAHQLTGVTVLTSPRSTHNWRTVKLPTQAIVNRPTHLTLTVAPRPKPVIASQNHHPGENALDGPRSCTFVKHVNANPVKAVMIMRGESRRINRACVKRPFSSVSQYLLTREKVAGKPTKYNESSTQERCDCPATCRFQRQKHCWHQEDPTNCWEKSHGNIGDTGLNIVLSNLLKVEIAVESSQPSSQCEE